MKDTVGPVAEGTSMGGRWNVRLSAVAVMLAVLLAACGGPGAARVEETGSGSGASGGTRIEPPKALADFTLTSHTGATFGLRDLRGKPALLFFGYTNCPDICPTTMLEWKKVKNALGADASKVAFVFISVDGERDTPDVVKQFVQGYDSDFIGLTGDEATLRTIAKDFGVYFNHAHDKESNPKNLVDHGSYSFLLDHDARLNTVYRYGIPAETISGDVQGLLRADVS
ncbi:MAG TPA: SCO family protein [Herpetosiphonaceae bacterium]|nr:SCO family protein [Herpetosiphonaceae bacterium]